MIWDIVVSITKYPTHEHGRDSSAVVCLCGEIDDRNNCSDEDVQRRASDTGGDTNIDRETDEVLDGATAVEND